MGETIDTPLYTEWTAWFECSVTCVTDQEPFGTQVRIRECVHRCNSDENKPYETRKCGTETICPSGEITTGSTTTQATEEAIVEITEANSIAPETSDVNVAV